MVSRNRKFLFYPDLVRLAFGKCEPDDISFDLRKTMLDRRVRFIEGEVARVDPHARRIIMAHGEVEGDVRYDYLIFALAHLLKQSKQCRSARVTIVSPDPPSLQFGDLNIAPAVRTALEEHAIEYLPDFPIERVTPSAVFTNNGHAMNYNLLMLMPPFRGPGAVTGLGITDDDGYIKVDRTMRVAGVDRMYAMRAFVLSLLSLFTIMVSLVFCPPKAPAKANLTDYESRLKAERLWEQAIAAKGGRERLYAIKNFVVSSKSRFRFSPRPDVAVGISEESLYILPGKWWNFLDYRPGKMGYSINVLDFDRAIWWTASPGNKVPQLSRPDLDKAVLEGFRYRFRQAQFLYLLETKWAKPTLVGARTDSIGFNKYDVVETVIAERQMRRLVQDGSTKRLKIEVIDDEREVRADFYLDRKTHLPVRIVTDSRAARGSGKGAMDDSCSLDDYAELGGIQMPGRVNCGDKENRTYYQFNVDYNKSIFEHPPTPDMKPDAWRVKVSRKTVP